MDDGNPHIRVGFQAEGEDGGADEEHRDYSNRLSKFFFYLELVEPLVFETFLLSVKTETRSKLYYII